MEVPTPVIDPVSFINLVFHLYFPSDFQLYVSWRYYLIPSD